MTSNISGVVLCDNGGGITLQLDLDERGEYCYAHYYIDGRQAGADLATYLRDATTEGWDGDDDEAHSSDITSEEERLGQGKVYSIVDGDTAVSLAAEMAEDAASWANVRDLRAALLAADKRLPEGAK